MPLLTIFINVLLPVLLLAGAGFLLGKILKVDPRPLGRVIFNILTPLLVFHLITQSQLSPGKIALEMGFAGTIMLAVGGLAFLLGKLMRLDRSARVAVILTSMFANNGNYGLPVIAFAFGQEAQAYASIYFVTSVIVLSSLGVVIASLGRLNLRQTLLGLLKVPSIYAILLAMVFVRTGWPLPEPIQRTVSLGAGGAVPAMLVLLGLELQRAEWNRNWRAVSIPVILRLIIGPLLGWLISGWYGLQGAARQAGVAESGLSTAVMTTVLASEYKLDSSLVSAIIFVSTILSPLSLTFLLFYLGM